MQVASTAYKLEGYVLDFFIVPDTTVATFQTGITYYVKSYSNGTNVTFQSNTVIKLKNAAYMLLYGTMNFPASQPYAIFTSRDDDLFGEQIVGVPGETNSDGNPTDHLASPAIWIYYVDASKTITNARVRWAVKGIQFDGNVGVNVTHTLSNSIFEQCQVALRNNLPSGSVALTNIKQCGSATPIAGPGFYTGTITTDCGVVNASQFLKNQGEPAIAVRTNPADTSQIQIVIIAMHPKTNLDDVDPQAMLRMISNDSGLNWSTNVIANGSSLWPAEPDSDPSISFDDWGNLFLAYRANTNGIRTALFVSTDAGANWNTVPGFDGSGATGATPKVTTGPKLGSPLKSSVWVTLDKGVNSLVATGTEVRGSGTDNIGPTWTSQTALENANSASNFSSIAIGPNGEVMVVYIRGTGTSRKDPPVTIYMALDNDGLGSGTFTNKTSLTVTNLGWLEIPAMDYNEVVPIPTLDWDRARNKLYVVFPDRSSTATNDFNLDIYVCVSTNKADSWSGRQQVNDNVGAINTTASQFHPRLAVEQDSGKVAVSWYDCRKDSSNIKTHFFAAVSQDGFNSAQPRNFQLNPSQSDASVAWPGLGYREYVGLAFFKGFLYPVWIDNSNSTGNNPNSTSKFDVYTGKVAY